MTTELILYGTSACHLCEDALEIIQPAVQALGLKLNLVDIAGDDALESRYGLSIPVLSYTNGNDLCWPFDTDSVSKFLKHHKN